MYCCCHPGRSLQGDLMPFLGECMLERPLLIPLASLIAGLCMADLLSSAPPAWALAALITTTLAASLVKGRLPFLLSVSMLFFVWGGVSLKPFFAPDETLSLYLTERPVLIEGVIDERPEALPSGASRLFVQVERLYLEKEERAVSGRLLVNVKGGRAQLYSGDRILLSSKLRKPRNYGLPGEIDYVRRLAYRSVFTTAFVKTADDLVLVRAGNGWRHDLDRLAARLGRFITEQAPGVEEGGILKALLLGDKGDVSEQLNDAYARSGVNHILSISGFHVGIIFLTVFQLLLLAARRVEFLALHLNLRKTLLLAALPVVVFYLFLSGTAPATVRSVLVIAAFILALQMKRELDPVNTVMLAACAILFAAPQTLFDVSFQLSFLAIWGLVVLTPPLAAPLQRLWLPLRWILLLVVASAAAILATLVPVAYYFHRISFIGLVANLAVVPLMGYGAVVAGFASLPLSFLAPAPAAALVHLAAYLVRLSDRVIELLARAPVVNAYAPDHLDFLLATLLLCAVTFPRSRGVRLLSALSLLLVLAIRAVPGVGAGAGELRIHFLSVGQGDASLVQLPAGKWMLVDGGGRAGDNEERIGERLLNPALNRLGVQRLDYLVLSHEHPDHLQGVLYLAESFEVGEFWESGVASRSPEYQRLKWVLSARGIPVRRLNASIPPFTVAGAVIEPLWPPSLAKETGDANDTSLVFRLAYRKSSVLFTGDLGGDSEEELLARRLNLHASILKVGHHGSKYGSSDTFLKEVSPRVAVISAGYRNPFHLPAPSTLARLQSLGIRVYRTDLDGTVDALCDPDGTVRVSTRFGAF
jgi:competence protein ComEC